jgi:pyruvate,water dikinase
MLSLVNLSTVNSSDINLVGGKNASIGEMIQHLAPHGIKVPGGFATTTLFYKEFITHNQLGEKISHALTSLDIDNVAALEKTATKIRAWIVAGEFPKAFEEEVEKAYAGLNCDAVAVRSSATAEDLATASFAGQQDTFLNVKGLQNVLQAIKMVFASLFTTRAMAYRHHQGFDINLISISAGIQPMVRSDKGVSGVMFTLDTESGFDQVVLITASYGLGEALVQGQVNPDEFCVFKPSLQQQKLAILQRRLGSKAVKMVYTRSNHPGKSVATIAVPPLDQERFCLTDKEIELLARAALVIEKHYGRSMDIEWAKDGLTGEFYILQARPETVKNAAQQAQVLEQYSLDKKAELVVQGQSIGQKIGSGKARVILHAKNMHDMKPGEVLVTDMTDPDWEPIMKQASAIVTNRGGRTCHAAIIARELGIPAVVGCIDATKRIKSGDKITVSCAEGQAGYVYAGELPFTKKMISVKEMPDLPVKLSLNLGNPDRAFATQFLPNAGVGLARLEFIISNMIGIHPNALLNFNTLPKLLKQQIKKKTAAYATPLEFYIEKLCEGISLIAAAFYPKQVIFRFSDFKTNEYANLLGGELYEPKEENPMIGYRGASRYTHKNFCDAFTLECEAFKRVRNAMGLTNAQVMVPFVRTVEELQNVITTIEANGLKRGEQELKIYMMCEVPSNALLAEEFLKYVDGFSIGSNDLTQLTLGLDRDSSLVAHLFDERNDAVKLLLHTAIAACKKAGKYIGICGQAPSDYPDFAEWLMKEGIENISLNPDSLIETWLMLAESNVAVESIKNRLGEIG